MTKKWLTIINHLKESNMYKFNLLSILLLSTFLFLIYCKQKSSDGTKILINSPVDSISPPDYKLNGIYRGLGALYILEKTNSIQGYFQNYRGKQFSTIFFITGSKVPDSNRKLFKISTFYPGETDTIKGFLSSQSSEHIQIILDSPPPGGEFSLEETKDDFEKIENKKWEGIGYVVGEKIPFDIYKISRAQPSRYLIRNDCFGLLGNDGDRLHIEYFGKNKSIEGWVSKKSIDILSQ